MKLMTRENLRWHDLSRIESPFFARSKVSDALGASRIGNHLWGLEDILIRQGRRIYNNRWDDSDKRWLLEKLEKAELFLVIDYGEPFSPLLKWMPNEEDSKQGHWKIDTTLDLRAEFNARGILDNLPNRPMGSVKKAEPGLWDKAVGGVKELGNQVMRKNAAILSEATGVSYIDKETGETVNIAEEGKDMLPPANDGEQAGADAIKNMPETPAIVAIAMAAASGGKSALKNPTDFAHDLKSALHNSRSPSEAMGKAGMEQAKRRQGHNSDPGYTDRYHGPDDITRKDGKLAEWEAKGNGKDSNVVAKDNEKFRQGSSAKNAKRARKMVEQKSKKIGQPSNRQGGSYTSEEIDLWQDIANRDGKKQHISTHTNTETGQVKVFERDHKGNITQTLDEFEIDNFNEMKQAISEAFK